MSENGDANFVGNLLVKFLEFRRNINCMVIGAEGRKSVAVNMLLSKKKQFRHMIQ